MPPIITLTTDFGLEDPFVGIMKGVLLNLAPESRIVDITHNIDPQNVRQGALVLQTAYPWFPKDTIHVAVVDPGVGSGRKSLAVKMDSHYFVGPDNGVLTAVLNEKAQVYELNRPEFFLETVSSTFQGRDVYAPAAAWLARKTPLASMGEIFANPHKLDLPEPVFQNGALKGEIIYIDRFGNLFSNLTRNCLKDSFGETDHLEVRIANRSLAGLIDTYSDRQPGELGALINSWDRLEIFSREGNAAHALSCGLGEPITVSRTE